MKTKADPANEATSFNVAFNELTKEEKKQSTADIPPFYIGESRFEMEGAWPEVGGGVAIESVACMQTNPPRSQISFSPDFANINYFV